MGIKHATRAAGTKINTSAVWAEDHEIEAGTIVDADIANSTITASKLASDARFYRYVQSGSSPITFAHGLSQAPTGVVATPKAVQPYAWAVTWDATNIKIYHNAVGSLTFSVIAWI